MIRIYSYGQVPTSEIFSRQESRTDVSAAVAAIIAVVRQEGDTALRRYAKEFDKAELTEIEVPAAQLDAAVDALDGELRAAEREDLDRVLEFTAIHAFLLGLRTGAGLGALIPQGTAPSAPGPSACTPP